MREEKKYLVEEVGRYLDSSNYVFLADYNRIKVDETAELRASLSEHGAEFHVVKNRILNVAAQARGYPDLTAYLEGPTAIIIGGDNPPAVSKVLGKFFKDKDKVKVKAGLLESQALSAEDVDKLADMPSKQELQAKLLGLLTMPGTNFVRLLNTPGTQLVTVLEQVPSGLLTVLKAKAEKDGEAA